MNSEQHRKGSKQPRFLSSIDIVQRNLNIDDIECLVSVSAHPYWSHYDNTSFPALAPKVAFGSVGCIASGTAKMTEIASDVISRMPREAFRYKCAWAARTELSNLYTTAGGICSLSSTDTLPPSFFSSIASKPKCGDKEDEVFFVAGMYQIDIGAK